MATVAIWSYATLVYEERAGHAQPTGARSPYASPERKVWQPSAFCTVPRCHCPGESENLHKFYDPLTCLLRRLYDFSARIAHTPTRLGKDSVVSPVWVGFLVPAEQTLAG